MNAAAASESAWRHGVADQVEDPSGHSDVLSLKEACSHLHAIPVSFLPGHLTVHSTPALEAWAGAEVEAGRAETWSYPQTDEIGPATTWYGMRLHGVDVRIVVVHRGGR